MMPICNICKINMSTISEETSAAKAAYQDADDLAPPPDYDLLLLFGVAVRERLDVSVGIGIPGGHVEMRVPVSVPTPRV